VPEPGILERIVAKKRERLAAARTARPLAEVRAAARDAAPTRDFAAAVRAGASGERGAIGARDVRVIAEIKRRSPSKGLIRADFDPVAIARAYAAGGADACSILTEEDFFDGRLSYLADVRAAVPFPLLRKDFLFDPYQVYEARAAGADAVLLIAASLAPAQLADLAALAAEIGLATLVEVHDESEVASAVACPAAVIGINNRDLRTFVVSLDTAARLARLVPAERTIVAESGIHGPADVARLGAAGIHAFLVGEHLMQAPDPAAALRALKGGAA
jgi:indole-3-glycerol phosphate synthase